MTVLCAVVITRNAADELAATLDALTSYSWLDRVVVSDDSDSDAARRTAQVAASYDALYVPGPKRGPTPNRANGLMYARRHLSATHVLFVDDDMTISEEMARNLKKVLAAYPGDILCPVAVNTRNGQERPTEVNWRGLRSQPAPATGGYGLTDNFMLWPTTVADELEWDDTFPYGYSEAWLGYQAQRRGCNIRILSDVGVIHRSPGRHAGDLGKHSEPARVYYNFLIKLAAKGRTRAWALFLADALRTSSWRCLRGQNTFGMYARLVPLLVQRSADRRQVIGGSAQGFPEHSDLQPAPVRQAGSARRSVTGPPVRRCDPVRRW
jgi:hypothetical protein